MHTKTTGPTLHIDWTRCDGHGTCADLLPDLIHRDDWGFPVLRHPTPQDAPINRRQHERAQLAIDACPMLALKLIAPQRPR